MGERDFRFTSSLVEDLNTGDRILLKQLLNEEDFEVVPNEQVQTQVFNEIMDTLTELIEEVEIMTLGYVNGIEEVASKLTRVGTDLDETQRVLMVSKFKQTALAFEPLLSYLVNAGSVDD